MVDLKIRSKASVAEYKFKDGTHENCSIKDNTSLGEMCHTLYLDFQMRTPTEDPD